MTWQHIFINPQRQVLRSGWRVVVFFMILFPLTIAFGSLSILLTGGRVSQLPGEADPFDLMIQNLMVIIAALLASAVCLRAFDRRPLRSIGYLLHTGWWRDYLAGTAVAAGMMTAIVGIGWVAGTLSLQWSDASAHDVIYGFAVSLLFFNIAAAFEEVVFRGYPLQTMLRDLPPVWGVIVTSVLFGVAHSLNPNASLLGLFNTTLAGVWLAIAYLKTRNLWLCTSLHWSWNWTMSAIYGLNVSGLEGIVDASLLRGQPTGPQWFTGGEYGPEGGVLATAVVSVSTLWLWRVRWLVPHREPSLHPLPVSETSTAPPNSTDTDLLELRK